MDDYLQPSLCITKYAVVDAVPLKWLRCSVGLRGAQCSACGRKYADTGMFRPFLLTNPDTRFLLHSLLVTHASFHQDLYPNICLLHHSARCTDPMARRKYSLLTLRLWS